MSKRYRAKSNFWLRREITYMERYPAHYRQQIISMLNELLRRAKLAYVFK
jgi:hypothetical protein